MDTPKGKWRLGEILVQHGWISWQRLEAVLEIHQDAIPANARVVIVDDLLATGGTAFAAAKLVEKSGAKVELIAFMIELLFLKGSEKLRPYNIFSVVQY